jgi:hypothetical protein
MELALLFAPLSFFRRVSSATAALIAWATFINGAPSFGAA